MNYKEAQKLISKARHPFYGRPIAKHTRLIASQTDSNQTDSNWYGVKYHKTIVVLVDKRNTYTINTGGWHTKTTKDRIHSYSPACITSYAGQWFLYTSTSNKVSYWKLIDGIRIDKTGKPIGRHKKYTYEDINNEFIKPLRKRLRENAKYHKALASIEVIENSDDYKASGIHLINCNYRVGQAKQKALDAGFKKIYLHQTQDDLLRSEYQVP